MKIFNSYPNKEQALVYKELFASHNIDCTLVVNAPLLDNILVGNNIDNKFILKLNQEDFIRARELIIDSIEINIEELSEDYYLLHFTDEELKDVVINLDEWGEYDVALSRKLLKEKGVVIDEELLGKTIQKQSEPPMNSTKNKTSLLISGYIFAFAGGLLGIVIGYHLWKHRKVLMDGTDWYIYSESTRQHGKIIFCLGIFMTILWVVFRIWRDVAYFNTFS